MTFVRVTLGHINLFLELIKNLLIRSDSAHANHLSFNTFDQCIFPHGHSVYL